MAVGQLKAIRLSFTELLAPAVTSISPRKGAASC